MVINKKVLISILLVFGVLLGIGAVLMYKEIVKVIQPGVNNTVQENEFTMPYFSTFLWNWGYSTDDLTSTPWEFYVFQPKIVEYKSENGLNYIVGEYRFDDNENSPKRRMNILVSKGDNWSLDREGLDRGLFESIVKNEIILRKSFNSEVSDGWSGESVSFDELKDKLPVGSRVAVGVPVIYPDTSLRSEEYCSLGTGDLCDWARIWDILSPGLNSFPTGGVPSDSFILVPYSISTDVYKDI